jgi:hypothetical protein
MSDQIFLKTYEAARRGGPSHLRLSPRRVVYEIGTLDVWARAREFRSTSEYSA